MTISRTIYHLHYLTIAKKPSFSPSQLTINSNSPASKQAVILHDGPTTVPTSLVSQLVRTDGIGSLFITNDGGSNPYGSFPADWSNFVSTVASD